MPYKHLDKTTIPILEKKIQVKIMNINIGFQLTVRFI